VLGAAVVEVAGAGLVGGIGFVVVAALPEAPLLHAAQATATARIHERYTTAQATAAADRAGAHVVAACGSRSTGSYDARR